MDLNPSMNKLFSERIIKLLNKGNVNTVIDFVKDDLYRLTQITDLDRGTITKIKDDFVGLLSSHEGFGFRKDMIRTGIDRYLFKKHIIYGRCSVNTMSFYPTLVLTIYWVAV